MSEDKGQKMPFIGDKFPDLEVKTTQGVINVPEEYRRIQFSQSFFRKSTHFSRGRSQCSDY